MQDACRIPRIRSYQILRISNVIPANYRNNHKTISRESLPAKYLIKYASRGRPEEFKKNISTIFNTIGNVEYKILCSFDSDDASMNNDHIKEFIHLRPRIEYYFGEHISKIDAINRDIDKTTFDWNILINYSDEMNFRRQNWGERMEVLISDIWPDFKDFFAHFNDGYVSDKLPTMSIIDREYYNRDGYIYFPSYKSFSCDAEAMYVAMMRGRYHYFNEVLFTHDHMAYTGQRPDNTYQINSMHEDYDVSIYFDRMKTYFDVKNPPPKLKRLLERELRKYFMK